MARAGTHTHRASQAQMQDPCALGAQELSQEPSDHAQGMASQGPISNPVWQLPILVSHASDWREHRESLGYIPKRSRKKKTKK